MRPYGRAETGLVLLPANFGKIQVGGAYGQGSRKKCHMVLVGVERALAGASGPTTCLNKSGTGQSLV